MTELKIYYDKDKTKVVEKDLVFDPVPVGVSSNKELFVFNTLNYPVFVDVKFTGDVDVKVLNSSFEILGKAFKKLKFLISPSVTKVIPIKGSLSLDYRYVVR